MKHKKIRLKQLKSSEVQLTAAAKQKLKVIELLDLQCQMIKNDYTAHCFELDKLKKQIKYLENIIADV